MKMLTSIKQRLLIVLMSSFLVIWTTITLIIYFESKHEIEELFDANLAQSAKILLSLVAEELYEQHDEVEIRNMENSAALKEIEEHLEKHKYEKLLAFQINVKQNNFEFISASAPKIPLSSGGNGFSQIKIDDNVWRVFSLSDPRGLIEIRVGEPLFTRSEIASKISLHLDISIMIAFPVLAFLIWHIVSRSLLPLQHLTESISKRDPSQLTPIEGRRIPDEVVPMVNALNRLLERLDAALENERRFTADAAHELRTPLAGIKAQAQLGLHTKDDETRRSALHNVILSVDRNTHTVEQLLALARVDPDHNAAKQEEINLTRLTRDVLSEFSPMAIDKQIQIELCSNEELHITGNSHTIAIMLRNLIDNAIRFTNYGGKVTVSLKETESEVIFCVDDSGPGIPDEMLERVFNRFYKMNKSQELGSGLGLSIVNRIVELHGANIILDKSPLKGLQAKIFFPVSPMIQSVF